jgi:2-oxoglutarate ferredoxin oxidoreductase subunit beta
MSRMNFEKSVETAWCPGCGNHGILEALRVTLDRMMLDPHEVLVVGGIGQAAKLPQYLNTNGFCGLHGRALPPAAAAKIVNPALTVIIDTGDGDSYGEGGNHFLHNIRRNADITHFVHNNQIYALTKGQASPTTGEGQITETQPLGVQTQPMNPIAIAIAAGAGFVARAFSGDADQLSEIMERAIRHRGYSLVDILQPCVSFNKVNTYQWYKERVYTLGNDHDRTDYMEAMKRAIEWGERIPTGILFETEKPLYGDHLAFLKDGLPMIDRGSDPSRLQKYIRELM